ncbi:hypothetical protein GGR73_003314 [Xanthomonas sp. F14]
MVALHRHESIRRHDDGDHQETNFALRDNDQRDFTHARSIADIVQSGLPQCCAFIGRHGQALRLGTRAFGNPANACLVTRSYCKRDQ